jgi:putative sensory transduction regulator
MNAFVKGLLVVAVLGFGAAVANAQVVLPGNNAPAPTPQAAPASGLITKITAQQVAQLVTNAVSGVTISPQITNNSDGTFLVTFPVWGSAVYSAISVENCEQDGSGCYVLDFFANFGKQPTLTTSWMNAWNDQFYIARVYPLSTGETVFTADLAILTGVTPDYVTAFAGFFKQVVDNASTFKPAAQ